MRYTFNLSETDLERFVMADSMTIWLCLTITKQTATSREFQKVVIYDVMKDNFVCYITSKPNRRKAKELDDIYNYRVSISFSNL